GGPESADDFRPPRRSRRPFGRCQRHQLLAAHRVTARSSIIFLRQLRRSSAEVQLFFTGAFDIATSSLPSIARGNSMALNSAPTSITSDIMYIQTRRVMPTPREP